MTIDANIVPRMNDVAARPLLPAVVAVVAVLARPAPASRVANVERSIVALEQRVPALAARTHDLAEAAESLLNALRILVAERP